MNLLFVVVAYIVVSSYPVNQTGQPQSISQKEKREEKTLMQEHTGVKIKINWPLHCQCVQMAKELRRDIGVYREST
jgi:hypothetical protein